jgi:hypothetical protein
MDKQSSLFFHSKHNVNIWHYSQILDAHIKYQTSLKTCHVKTL